MISRVVVALAVLAAAPTFAASPNAGCPYAADNLRHAAPDLWKSDAEVWDSKGRLSLPSSGGGIVSAKTEGDRQFLTAKGGGLLFARGAGGKTRVVATFDVSGHLLRVELSSSSGQAKWTEALDYGYDGGGCRLKRVVVGAPELQGIRGVSFDERLCEQLDRKKLLDPKRSESCGDCGKQIGEVIERFSTELPAAETFTLVTSAPDGSTRLKKYRDVPLAGIAVASDCAFSWRAEEPASADEGGVERGNPIDGTSHFAP